VKGDSKDLFFPLRAFRCIPVEAGPFPVRSRSLVRLPFPSEYIENVRSVLLVLRSLYALLVRALRSFRRFRSRSQC
jgi:hypothetical protein